MKININRENKLFESIAKLLTDARSNIVKNVNKTMVYTYFDIGKLIIEEQQHGKEKAE